MTEKESTGKSTKVARPSKKQAKKKRRIWPWVVLAFLLVFVALPAGLFAYAYSQYTVPEPKDLANNQVSTIYAGDNQTQLARLVPPEGNRTHVNLDEIPDYLTGDILLTTLRMEHLERAHVAMLFLEQEMKGAISCKFKSFSTCKIIPGQTVK